MKWRGYVVLVYGMLILVGGIIGYVKAQSIASLVMGGGCAAVAMASGWGILTQHAAGRISALALSIVLLAFFGYRFMNSGNFMPAGFMALLSVLVIGMLAIGHKKSEKITE